jgi:hypothetical protein
MKRISLILASLVLLFGTKASAFVGGPFDNGDFNTLLDDSGIYQVSFRFSNGSGFAQFGNNVDAELFLPQTGGTATTPASTYSILNRSIIYYKGVTYLGTCTGMVDHDAKIVSGVTNGNSDVSTSQTTSTGGGATFSSSNSLNFNGLGFPCNTEFRCKITKTHPILRFSGKGELTIVNPSVSGVAFQALQTIITTGASGNLSIGGQISSLVTALTANNGAIASVIPSAEQTFENSEHAKMTVFGSRIFFNSRR